MDRNNFLTLEFHNGEHRTSIAEMLSACDVQFDHRRINGSIGF